MGFGDEILGSGLAKGLQAIGKRAAFGFINERRIAWSREAFEIYRGNPNVAEPGCERDADLVWIQHCHGSRLYLRAITPERHILIDTFRAEPGEVYFDTEELNFGRRAAGREPFVVIESRTKPVYPNKQWGSQRWAELVYRLAPEMRLIDFTPGLNSSHSELGIEHVRTRNFRLAMAVLQHAELFIGPEGGLHHAAAALGIPAIVIFGGWANPTVTGYKNHINLTGGANPCGSVAPCRHCALAMAAITPAHVAEIAKSCRRATSNSRTG